MGCAQQKNVNPIQHELQTFDTEFKKYSITYGLKTIQSKKQNISNIDCLVFNETAKNSIPQNLGQLSAFTDSLYYRIFIGCVDPLNALTQYETARRVLKQQWDLTLQKMPYSSQSLFKQSPAGQKIEDQIKHVVTEQMVCYAQMGSQSKQSRSDKSIQKILNSCPSDKSITRIDQQCFYSSQNIFSLLNANQPMDDLAYISLYLSRYRQAFNVCGSNSSSLLWYTYQHTPPELFQQSLYRFSYPIDAVFQCSVDKITSFRSRQKTIVPKKAFVDCGKTFNLSSLYSYDSLPDLFSEDHILEKDKKKWLYNPQKSSENPEIWSFGDCEKTLISTLKQNHLNIVSPVTLRQYCLMQKKPAY